MKRFSDKYLLLSGNEAIALGAFEASVRVASAYPGTPSTEILESLSQFEDVYTEWAPNEKVALEVALGASFAGARAMASMKHVGLNVAADPLFTAAYTGVRGGLVVITADDPAMHSSQNAQDNRNYAIAAKIPMLEPSDPQEAKEFTKLAFKLSESFDTPVLLRTTTRLSHVSGIVKKGRIQRSSVVPQIVKIPQKFVMLPAHARLRRLELDKRLRRLKAFSERFSENKIIWGSKDMGIITSGVTYQYVREALPEVSVLKISMVYPLPERLIKEFASKVRKLYVVEELDPYMEIQIKAMGVKCTGKEVIPSYGELSPEVIRKAITGKRGRRLFPSVEIPARPPVMCPGCPHRGVFYVLSKLKVFVSGDIGCYTLAASKPLSAMDTCVCMGASIGGAFGMEKALGKEALGKTVAVIGDSTFIHSGITGLIDIVYNKGFTTVIILDNRTTAMTGHQPNPVTGQTAKGEPTEEIDLEALCRAIGVRHVYTVNPHDINQTEKILKQEIKRPEPSVVITKYPCALLPEERRKPKPVYVVIADKCKGCRMCLKLGCPSIHWVEGKGRKKGKAVIDGISCVGCGECEIVCKFDAIVMEDPGEKA